ncbi:MAG: hypothetical protein N2558_03680 [Patescibacteria group bacterium]|nr:hypothetical protein [Patescibacteria group bacterium]
MKTAIISTAQLHLNIKKTIDDVYIGKINLKNIQIFFYFKDSLLQPKLKAQKFLFEILQSSNKEELEELIYMILLNFLRQNKGFLFSVMVVCGNDITCFVSPNIGFSILRGDSYGVLLSSQSSRIQAIKGKIMQGDILLFGTSEVFLLSDQVKFILKRKVFNYCEGDFSNFCGSGVVYECIGFSNSFNKNLAGLGFGLFSNMNFNRARFIFPRLLANYNFFFLNLKNFVSRKKVVESVFVDNNYNRFKSIVVKSHNVSKQIEKNQSFSLLVGVFCLFVLIFSAVLGFWRNQENQKKAVLESKTKEVEKEIIQAIELANFAPEGAREIFVRAKDKVLGLANENRQNEKVLLLLEMIEENRKELLKEYQVNPSQFIDLTLLSSNFYGNKLILSDGSLYIWDKNNAKLAKVVVSSKRSEILVGPAILSEALDVNVYTNKVYFFYKNGIKQLGDVSFLYEGNFEEDDLFYSYAANFYLAKRKNQILRISADYSGKYVSNQSWLRQNADVNFREAKQMIVDGFIWILSEKSNITKMYNGLVQPFKLVGVSPNIEEISRIYTSYDSQSFCILDKLVGRVIFVSKDGKFIAQYVSEQIKDAIDFAVFEKERKAFLLLGEKLLFFDLEHLVE